MLLNSLTQLTTFDWGRDYGFRKALLGGAGPADLVAYWQREKSNYRLWELLGYMDSWAVAPTLAYFDLPADTLPFLKWVYNHVAHQELHRVAGADQELFGGAQDQQHYFPYPQLYLIWSRETAAQRASRPGNVKVYLDRLTEPDGRELLRFQAPTFFE